MVLVASIVAGLAAGMRTGEILANQLSLLELGAGAVLGVLSVWNLLEILFDLDVEAQAFAQSRSIKLRRTASFNDRPDFIAAMAQVVSDALADTPNFHGPRPMPREGEFPARRL